MDEPFVAHHRDKVEVFVTLSRGQRLGIQYALGTALSIPHFWGQCLLAPALGQIQWQHLLLSAWFKEEAHSTRFPFSS